MSQNIKVIKKYVQHIAEYLENDYNLNLMIAHFQNEDKQHKQNIEKLKNEIVKRDNIILMQLEEINSLKNRLEKGEDVSLNELRKQIVKHEKRNEELVNENVKIRKLEQEIYQLKARIKPTRFGTLG